MSTIDDAAKAVEHLGDTIDQGMEDLSRSDVDLAVVDSEYRQPWDQQDGESNIHYAQFVHYRDQGLGRTVAATHRHFNGKPKHAPGSETKKRPHGKLTAISYATPKKYEWEQRASSFDMDQERQYQLARSEAIREMVVRHEVDIEEAIGALMIPIKALSTAMEEDEEFIASLSRTDAKKLISLANQSARTIPSLMSAERLARDMPTEIVGGTIDHRHVVAVERDQIGEILEVLGRAGVLDDGDRSLGTGEIVDAEVVDVYPIPAEDND